MFVLAVLFSALSVLCVVPAVAQSSQETGKLKIHVDPKQAYVFVDGKAIRDGSQTIELAAGDHKVGVYNYGYTPKMQDVHVGAGETTDLRVNLQSTGDMVAGPVADIEFKGDPRADSLAAARTEFEEGGVGVQVHSARRTNKGELVRELTHAREYCPYTVAHAGHQELNYERSQFGAQPQKRARRLRNWWSLRASSAGSPSC